MVAKNRLPRTACLKSRRDIEGLFSDGRRCKQSSLICIWQQSDRFEYGVFVSRDLGSAVERNRIKRLLREAIRLCRSGLKKPVRLGLVPNRNSLQTGFEQIHAEVEQSIEHINNALN